MRNVLGAGLAVFAAVRAADTSEQEIRQAVSAKGFVDEDITAALCVLERQRTIVQVRPGIWQRWHGQEAQKKLYKKESDG